MRRPLTLLLLVLGAACAGETPTEESGLSVASAGPDQPREAVARRIARALADPAFRAEVHAALAASTLPEGKIHLGRFLRAENSRAARAIGAEPEEISRAEALERAGNRLDHGRARPADPRSPACGRRWCSCRSRP